MQKKRSESHKKTIIIDSACAEGSTAVSPQSSPSVQLLLWLCVKCILIKRLYEHEILDLLRELFSKKRPEVKFSTHFFNYAHKVDGFACCALSRLYCTQSYSAFKAYSSHSTFTL
jgi:hypothetical protein